MTRPSLAEDASPEAFAEAMLRCQGYAPACGDARECAHDGHCFTVAGKGFAGARRAICDAIDHAGDVAARIWLKVALDALDHERFRERNAIDAMTYSSIQREIREKYEARHRKP